MLNWLPNSYVVQVWLQTDKAAYLLRQYFFNNLHDRLSTRPFLSQIAKKWLAFQVTSLFFGVHACVGAPTRVSVLNDYVCVQRRRS
jgi:hypothetical protein